jgi:hypothetical protein
MSNNGEDSELNFNDDDKSYRSLHNAHAHRPTPHLNPCGTLVAYLVEHDALHKLQWSPALGFFDRVCRQATTAAVAQSRSKCHL